MGETIARAASSVPESRANPISTSIANPASLCAVRLYFFSQTVMTIFLASGSIFLAVEVVIKNFLSFYTYVSMYVCSTRLF